MIRFFNGKVLTMEQEDMTLHDDYEVWVDGTSIVHVGPVKLNEMGSDEGHEMPSFEREVNARF